MFLSVETIDQFNAIESAEENKVSTSLMHLNGINVINFIFSFSPMSTSYSPG